MSNESTPSQRPDKTYLLLAAVQLAVAAALFGAFDKNAAMGVMAFLATVCLGFSFIGEISEFKASASGFAAKMREVDRVVDEASAKVAQVQGMAALLCKLQVSMLSRNGRLDQFNDVELDGFYAEIVELLKALGVTTDRQKECLAEARRFVIYDYPDYVLRRHKPDGLPRDLTAEWNALLGTIDDQPSPEAIAEFLERHGLSTPERTQMLDDMRYYIEHGEHRDPGAYRRLVARPRQNNRGTRLVSVGG